MNEAAPVDRAMPADAPDPCLICGGREAALRHPPTFRGNLADAPDFFLAHRKSTAHGPIVECLACGFVFTSPRFSAAEYDAIYASIPTPHEGENAYEAAKHARFQRLARIVRKHLPENGPFIDFGCGDGAFLRQMNDAAGKGFEIGAPARRQAGPSDIILGDWADTVSSGILPPRAFDAVTAFDVLEHLPRIEEDVGLIRSLLKPGGLFFASVPDITSIAARAMGGRWNLILLEHLWYFSPATLDAFLARFGFERVAMRSLPFDASVAHVATRLAQTFGMQGSFTPKGLARLVLPVPAGIMLGTYRLR